MTRAKTVIKTMRSCNQEYGRDTAALDTAIYPSTFALYPTGHDHSLYEYAPFRRTVHTFAFSSKRCWLVILRSSTRIAPPRHGAFRISFHSSRSHDEQVMSLRQYLLMT